jgi:hypothetical protein
MKFKFLVDYENWLNKLVQKDCYLNNKIMQYNVDK